MSQYGNVTPNYYLPLAKFNTLRTNYTYIIFFNGNILDTWCPLLLVVDNNLEDILIETINYGTGGLLYNLAVLNTCATNITNDSNILTETISLGTGGLLYNELVPSLNTCQQILMPEDIAPALPTAPADDSVNLYQITVTNHCLQSIFLDNNLQNILAEIISYGTGGLLYNTLLLHTCNQNLINDSNVLDETLSFGTGGFLYNEVITNSCGETLSNA